MDDFDRAVLKQRADILPEKFYHGFSAELGNGWYDIALYLEVFQTHELDMLRAEFPPLVPGNSKILNSRVLIKFRGMDNKILQHLYDALGTGHGRLRRELVIEARKYYDWTKESSEKPTWVTDGTDGREVVLPGVPADAETESKEAPVAEAPIRTQPAAATPVTGETQPAASIPSATQPAIASQASETTQPASTPVATVAPMIPMETEEHTTDESNPSRPVLYQLTSQEDIEDLL